MVTVKCKSCNETFSIEDSQDIIICSYCKTRWKVKRSDFKEIVNIGKCEKITRSPKELDLVEVIILIGACILWPMLWFYLSYALPPVINHIPSHSTLGNILGYGIILSLIIPMLSPIGILKLRRYLKKQKLKRQAEINGGKERKLTDKSQE